MIRKLTLWRLLAGLVVLLATGIGLSTGTPAVAQESTPGAGAAICAAIPKTAATPASGNMMDMNQGGMMATPGAGMPMMEGLEFDLLFIDMMIPHHESAVVMAQIALERAEHAEIRQLAQAIIAAQTSEIAQMQAWRDAWYPGAAAIPMDQMNAMMTGMMQGMMDMGGVGAGGLMAGMDMVQETIALCNAPEPFDIAFIDAMIPHHQSAIAMANVGLENNTHEELKTLELAIIDAQQAEIDQMMEWRAAWTS